MTKEEMFEKNQKLVYFVLNKKFASFRSNEDVIQDGMLGLWKACLYFSESKDTKFSTFACHCITNEINLGFRKQKKNNVLKEVSLEEIRNEMQDLTVSNDLNYWANLNQEEQQFVDKISRGDCDLLKTYGKSKLKKLKKDVQKKMDKESLVR